MINDIIGSLIRMGIFVGFILIIIYMIIRIIIKSTTEDIEIRKIKIEKLDGFYNGMSTGVALATLVFMYIICKWIYLLKLYKREKVGTYGNL